MADNLQKRPSKGILKNSSSFDKQEGPQKKQKGKSTQWDEMNIIATLHPSDKDYGHMKIEEPKTPYNWEEGEGEPPDELDASELAEKLRSGGEKPLKVLQSESESEDESETPEERAKRKLFESKRKAHYNEYQAIKLARKLIEAGEDEEEEEEEGASGSEASPKAGSSQ